MRRNIVLENNLQKSLDITRIERIIQVVDTPQPRLGIQGQEQKMAKTLKSIQKEIESLQSQYRGISSRNSGVIRGAENTSDIAGRINVLMRDYNSRAKRTMYSGGKIVSRND